MSPEGTIISVISIDNRLVTVRTRKGDELEIVVKKEGRETSVVEGAIESLFPLIPKAFSSFPGIVSEDMDQQLRILEEARYSTEKAVCLLRRHGYSARKSAATVIDTAIPLLASGVHISNNEKRVLTSALAREIKELYISTTEVRPRRDR